MMISLLILLSLLALRSFTQLCHFEFLNIDDLQYREKFRFLNNSILP